MIDDRSLRDDALPPSASDIRRAGCVMICDDVCPEIIGDLREAILSRAARSQQSHPTLNRGGWRSGEFFAWPDPTVAILYQAIARVVRVEQRRSLTGWAMINRRGSHHPRHVHQGAVATGVYVVDPGGRPTTPTVFEIGGDEVPVEPRTARLLLFPADMWHYVPVLSTEGVRVTIAFDIGG